jgi:hypothetical protein
MVKALKTSNIVTNGANGQLLKPLAGLLSITLGILLIGCSTANPSSQHTINGDWILMEYPEGVAIGPVGLRFMEDTMFTITNGGLINEGTFLMSEDTLIVRGFEEEIDKKRVKRLTSDTLVLMDFYLDQKYYSRKLEFTENLELDHLKIVAGTCYGDCPKFTLTLSRTGLIDFKPKLNCRTKEDVEFKIDQNKMNRIDSLFKWTYLQKLDTTGEYGAVDDWEFEIAIAYNKQTIKIRATHDYVPYRLKEIFHMIVDELTTRNLI